MTPAIKFVNMVKATDLRPEMSARMPEGSGFVRIVAIDFNYPGGQHMGQAEDATIRIDAGWGCCYLSPDEEVEVLTLETVDALIDYANRNELGRGFA